MACPRVLLCALLSLLPAACGDDGMAESTANDSTSSGTTGTSTNSTTNPTTSPSSGAPPDSTGSVDSDSTTGGGSTTDGDSTTDSASTTDGGSTTDSGSTTDGSSSGEESSSGTTGNQGDVVYSATAMPGGLDRIRINKADLDNDRCTWVILVAPPIPGQYPGMNVPAGWSVESISINDVAAACASDNPAMFGAEAATNANGVIGFGMLGATGIYPCTLDIDATLDFQQILPGIPPVDVMLAAGVPVTGC